MKTLLAAVLLGICAPLVGCGPGGGDPTFDIDASTTDASPSEYVCPPAGYVGCQPIGGVPRAPICFGAWNQWIRANCPGVTFVY